MDPTTRSEGPTDETALASAANVPDIAAGAGAADPALTGVGDADAVMTRSEERVRAVPGGRRAYEVVRLRRVIVEEERTVTVPVRVHQLVVDRVAVPEPVEPRSPGDASASVGDPVSMAPLLITLSEEEVVIQKRVVPKEIVRVTKELVTGYHVVEADVRKETINLEREQLPGPAAQPGRTTTPGAST